MIETPPEREQKLVISHDEEHREEEEKTYHIVSQRLLKQVWNSMNDHDHKLTREESGKREYNSGIGRIIICNIY